MAVVLYNIIKHHVGADTVVCPYIFLFHFIASLNECMVNWTFAKDGLVSNEEELLASTGDGNIEFAVNACAFHLLW